MFADNQHRVQRQRLAAAAQGLGDRRVDAETEFSRPIRALIAFGTLVAGLGLASLVYLYFEFRRVTRREALLAESRSTALQAR